MKQEAALVFAALLCILALTTSGFDVSEAHSDYEVAVRIATDHTLAMPVSAYGDFAKAPNGDWYSIREIGNSVFMLPVATMRPVIDSVMGSHSRQLQWLLLSLLSVFYCSVAGAFLYLILREIFDLPLKSALLSCAGLEFATYYWTYSRDLFDGVLCSAVLTGAAYFLFLFLRKGEARVLCAAFFLFGLGVTTRATMLIPATSALLTVALHALVYPKHRRRLYPILLALAAMLPFAFWQFYYNWLRTGNGLIFAVMLDPGESFAGFRQSFIHAVGLMASPGKGFIVYAPITLLSIYCFRGFWQKHTIEAGFIATVIIMWFFVHASRSENWYGAWGWGPRHFATVTPLAVIPWAVVRGKHRKLRPAEPLAIGLGFVLALSSIVGNWTYRLQLAERERRGGDDAIVWSLTGNQAIDMVRSSEANLRRMISGEPAPAALPGFSSAYLLTGTTANIWPVSAYHQHIPPVIILTVVTILILGCACSLWALFSITGGNRIPFVVVPD